MTGLIDWLAARARMVLFFVLISIGAGALAYTQLAKEGAPDIDVPVLYVSVPLAGISAEDSERLLVKPLEEELRGAEGMTEMTAFAAEGYAGVLLKFDFDWDQEATLADIRDRVQRAESEFPSDAEEPKISEVNLSELPIIVVSLSGDVPERTLLRAAKDMQRSIETIPAVLNARMQGQREEMVEVIVDPLRMESYDLTVADLYNIVDRNNQLVAAGQIEGATGQFSVSLPGSFEEAQEVSSLPIKVNGDRVVQLSDIADIRRTFEDRTGTAWFNGTSSISLRVSKRLGENIISTVEEVRAAVEDEVAAWPEPLKQAIRVDFALDESEWVDLMVDQLESSVLTAVILVMIVVLAALGFRSSLLVGIAIPCSFLLTFALMAVLGMSVNNMTMFGLILAVGMLVDGAIVVVEYADKRRQAGDGPMTAYTEAAKRMFWPIAASTGTTLCAFLPMLFWPGLAGQFMGQLPITIIFVLSASLIVALLYLPVLGGLSGRLSRVLAGGARGRGNTPPPPYRRTLFGRFISLIVMNPVGPIVALCVAVGAIGGTFMYYGQNNNGVEFFTDVGTDRAVVFVRARGNLSVEERDRLTRMVEERITGLGGIRARFGFAGASGGADGSDSPPDAVGQVQIQLTNWRERPSSHEVLAEVREAVADLPGLYAEVKIQEDGPQQGKPIQLELSGRDWDALQEAAAIARAKMESMDGIIDIDDTRPLPGIEWQITVDRAQAGRFGADIATIGPFVQFLTRGALIDELRADDSDDELEIRARFPDDERTLSTLDGLRVRTDNGMVPLSNFISRDARPRLGEIQRIDGTRFFLVRGDVAEGVSDVGMLDALEAWIEAEDPFPRGVDARFVGDREEQEESMQFLGIAFIGALGMMFVILLAQFNSIFNAILVLSAVVMSVAGVLIGSLVMGQSFSIIMTGVGIVALAGIVVNNNIVLIDTFQEFSKRLPVLEAIVRTAEDRIRPVMLTTITTMAGLTPMMFALSLDFGAGTITSGAPSALMWVQLATAVVWGLGFATLLTLVVTPAALAARAWATSGVGVTLPLIWHSAIALVWRRHRDHPFLADRRLRRALRERTEALAFNYDDAAVTEVIWETPRPYPVLRAAE
ncbi:MAG: efflux RND transporter permease subunit [Pseudomonadota bacterium]